MNPYLAIGYPRTWGDWVESPRNPDKETTIDANRDRDAYTDLLEYAFGESPSTSANGYPGFRIEQSPGNLEAVYERPYGLEDVRYVIEGSQNMSEWFSIGGDELVTIRRNRDGMETVRIAEIDNLRSADGIEPHFLRVRIDLVGGR